MSKVSGGWPSCDVPQRDPPRADGRQSSQPPDDNLMRFAIAVIEAALRVLTDDERAQVLKVLETPR